jgi:hypothetical protein
MHHWMMMLLEMVKCLWSSMLFLLPLMLVHLLLLLLLQPKSLLLNVEKIVMKMKVNYQEHFHHHYFL